MLIEMHIRRELNDSETVSELCEFRGIRWNNYGFVIFYTNHSRHDYIMPIEKEDYEKLERTIRDAYVKKARVIELVGDVYRVNRDNYNLSKESISPWSINVLGQEEENSSKGFW